MPPGMKYFLDPLKVIRHYKLCALCPVKSKLESLELGSVYKFITGTNLNGAHDSLVDVKAQTEIVTHPSFSSFINKSASICLIEDIFTASEKSKMANKLELEPSRPVHEPWKELDKDSTFQWTPRREDTYNGAGGLGGTNGPSQKMKDGARTCDLAEMFMTAFPLAIGSCELYCSAN